MKAFPQKYPLDPLKPYVSESNPLDGGMDLRDYFAAKAMQGLMAGRWQTDAHGARYDAYQADAKEWAKSAYVFANAMMEARK